MTSGVPAEPLVCENVGCGRTADMQVVYAEDATPVPLCELHYGQLVARPVRIRPIGEADWREPDAG